MKINIKKSILSVAAALLMASTSFAQFNGSIEFTKKVGTVEVNYVYYVSGDKIRIDEITDGKTEGYQLIDLKTKDFKGVSPDRKMYMDVPNKRPATELTVKVENTGKTKDIQGVKCSEIVVTCADKDRKIVYWVAKGDYNFFIPMLETLNRKENQSMFFLEIPNMAGHFPMLSTEYAISTGAVVSELSAGKVSKSKVDAAKFVIPSDFKKFER
jgi:hypothetical protein